MNLNSNDEVSFLHCIICNKNSKKPRMCPYCSKLACYDCISSWSSKQSQCPNCGTYLGFADYADCERFVAQIRQQFMLKEESSNDKDTCSKHHLKMRYFCEDCIEAFCPDCSAFTDTHKGHRIKLLSELYQLQKQRVQKQILRFDTRIQDYRTKSLSVKMQMQKLAQCKNQRKTFIQAYIFNLLTQLQYQFQQKQAIILSRYQANQEEVELLENIKDTILNEMEQHSQNEVIQRTQEVLHLIKSLCQRNVQQLEIDTNFTTIQELVPDYQIFTYTLSKFSTLNQDIIIYSPSQYFNGCEWRLKIYPQGNGIAKNKFISVFLQMTKGISNKIKYQYKIQLINHLNPLESMMRQYSSQFQISECWGYNQFIQLKTLELGYLVQDQLSFKFYVRNPTYKDMVIQQKKYINNLDIKLRDLQKSLQNRSSSQGNKQGRLRQIMQQMSLKKAEVRSELAINSIQNQALDLSHNKMQQKEQLIDN